MGPIPERISLPGFADDREVNYLRMGDSNAANMLLAAELAAILEINVPDI